MSHGMCQHAPRSQERRCDHTSSHIPHFFNSSNFLQIFSLILKEQIHLGLRLFLRGDATKPHVTSHRMRSNESGTFLMSSHLCGQLRILPVPSL